MIVKITPTQRDILAKALARKSAQKLKRWLVANPEYRQKLFSICKEPSDIVRIFSESVMYLLSGAIDATTTQSGLAKRFFAEVGSDLLAEMGDLFSETELSRSIVSGRSLSRLENDNEAQNLASSFHKEFTIVVDQDPKLSRSIADGFNERMRLLNERLEAHPRNTLARFLEGER